MKKRILVAAVVVLVLNGLNFAGTSRAEAKKSGAAVQAYLSKGDAFVDKGNYREAKNAYQKALELDPKSGDAYAGLGAVEYFQGKFRKALKNFQKAEKNGVQENWREGIYAYQGNSYLELNENEEAIKAFQKLRELNPRNPFAHQGLSAAYLKMDNMDGFIAYFEKEVALKPDMFGYYSLGQGYLAVKKHDKAEENFLKARTFAVATADEAFLKVVDAVLNGIKESGRE